MPTPSAVLGKRSTRSEGKDANGLGIVSSSRYHASTTAGPSESGSRSCAGLDRIVDFSSGQCLYSSAGSGGFWVGEYLPPVSEVSGDGAFRFKIWLERGYVVISLFSEAF